MTNKKEKKYFANFFLVLFSIFISLLFLEIFLYYDNKNFYDPIFYKKKLETKLLYLIQLNIITKN